MRRLMLLLLLSLLAPFARAQADDALLQSVLAELGKHVAVRADFTQTRSNPALDKPQVSQGQLLFVLGHGMLWQTVSPYRETLALTGDRSARIDADGNATAVRGDRGVSQVSQMLQGMLGGRLDEARRQFAVEAAWFSDVDLGNDRRVCRIEQRGILERLIFAFGYAEQGHANSLAKIVA